MIEVIANHQAHLFGRHYGLTVFSVATLELDGFKEYHTDARVIDLHANRHFVQISSSE